VSQQPPLHYLNIAF